MSNQEELDACLGDIQAIPDDEVKEPNMPVDTFVQEAEDLYTWCQEDIPELIQTGLAEDLIMQLPSRAGACRRAQSLWMKESRSLDQWNAKAPGAYDLRDELLHGFRFAFRNHDSLLSRLNEIAGDDGHDDMVQDLNDLAVLGNENQELLLAIGFDLMKLDTAASLSDEMAELLAVTNGSKEEGSEAKYLRDRAYTYLKMLVDEVRTVGKYIFWKNERRLKGYNSTYWRKKNSKKNEEEISDTEIVA